MQRRAAAALFVFFLVMGASAYSVISFAEQPDIDLEGAEAYSNGTNFTEDGQTYRVLTSVEDGTPAGTLQWYVPETTQNVTYENGTTAEVFGGEFLVTTGVTPNLDAAYVNSSGGVIPYASAAEAMAGGGNASGNASNATNATATPAASTGTPATDGTDAAPSNGTNVSAGNATAANGTESSAGTASTDTAANGTNASAGDASANDSEASAGPTASGQADLGPVYEDAEGTMVFTNTTDVGAVLESDPAVFNETITSEGQAFVRYTENGTFVPLSEYLPDADQRRVAEGESFELRIEVEPFSGDARSLNVSATVTNVSNSSAVVEYTAPEYNSLELEQGANVTLANGEQRIVNFRTSGSGNDTTAAAQLGANYSDYALQSETQESFTDRMTGLWNVIIITSIAALLVIGLAFLPVRG
jgi:hypothetical protein